MRQVISIHILSATIALSLVGYSMPSEADALVTTETVSRIAFGSCNSERKPQPLWHVIAKDEPSLWIWTGDNIYARTEDPQVFRAKYNRQLEHTGYEALARRVPFMTGT